jgi:hypothetical protein
MSELGRLPVVGDVVGIDTGELSVERLDGRRIDRIRFTPTSESEPETETEAGTAVALALSPEATPAAPTGPAGSAGPAVSARPTSTKSKDRRHE